MKIFLFVFGMFISGVTSVPSIPRKFLLIHIKGNNPADIPAERLKSTIPANGRSIRIQVEKIST